MNILKIYIPEINWKRDRVTKKPLFAIIYEDPSAKRRFNLNLCKYCQYKIRYTDNPPLDEIYKMVLSNDFYISNAMSKRIIKRFEHSNPELILALKLK